MFQVHTIPDGYAAFTTAAEAQGLEHGGRIADEGDVLASAMVWLGDTLLAYVAYTTGQDTIVMRHLDSEEITTISQQQAKTAMRAFALTR